MFKITKINENHHVVAITFTNGYTVSIAGGKGLKSTGGVGDGEYNAVEVAVFDRYENAYALPGADGIFGKFDYVSPSCIADIISKVSAL